MKQYRNISMAEQFYTNTPENHVTGRSMAVAAKLRPVTAQFRVRFQVRPISEQSANETNSFTEKLCYLFP